jgi:DnaJ-class molecular chaperone
VNGNAGGGGFGGGNPFGGGGGFGDIFGDIFGGGRQAQQNNRGADLRYDLEVSLLSLLRSGWCFIAKRLYAFLMIFVSSPLLTPNTS